MRRDDDALDVQQLERGRQQHRPGGAVGDEREVARVDAVADRRRSSPPRRCSRPRSGTRTRPAGRSAAACRAPRTPSARGSGSSVQLAAREAVRVEDPDQQAGVGDGRARRRRGRSRPGPGSTPALAGPDRDVAGRRDRDDAAAARADARDLRRERVDDQVVLELERVVDERLPVDDERDVGGGAADVAADEVAVADRLAEARCSRPCPRRGRRRRSGTAA